MLMLTGCGLDGLVYFLAREPPRRAALRFVRLMHTQARSFARSIVRSSDRAHDRSRARHRKGASAPLSRAIGGLTVAGRPFTSGA